jgi:hypothetical protein
MPEPTSITGDGNVKVSWVVTIANTATPASATELNAVSSVDLSEYLTGDGFMPDTGEDEVVDARLSTTQNFTRPGRISESLELQYVWQAQGTPTDNKAFTTLTYKAAGFVVVRWGVAYGTAFASGNKVDVYPAVCGIQRKQPPEANGILKVKQKIFVSSSVVRGATAGT